MNMNQARKSTFTINVVPNFQSLYRHLFVVATYDNIEPVAYIPFTKIGDTIDSSINKLIEFYYSCGKIHQHDDSSGLL